LDFLWPVFLQTPQASGSNANTPSKGWKNKFDPEVKRIEGGEIDGVNLRRFGITNRWNSDDATGMPKVSVFLSQTFKRLSKSFKKLPDYTGFRWSTARNPQVLSNLFCINRIFKDFCFSYTRFEWKYWLIHAQIV